MTNPLAAAVQMVSSDDLDANLRTAGALIQSAAEAGARLIVLPENFAYMGKTEAHKLQIAETPGDGPAQAFLAEQAAHFGVWLVGGTVAIAADDGRAWASCLVFDDQGRQVARFDKIHLFDVGVPDSDESYLESDSTRPGDTARVIDTPLGRLGLTVCYDLRFPELYRALSADGAELVVVPSAFTQATGRAHWETLVRARAIENLCYVIAPNQGGKHASGRTTYGDSMVVDPWGRILDRVPEGPGVALGEIDLDHQQRIRERFPALSHRRL